MSENMRTRPGAATSFQEVSEMDRSGSADAPDLTLGLVYQWDQNGVEETVINEIEPDGPADRAGLQVGDRVLSIHEDSWNMSDPKGPTPGWRRAIGVDLRGLIEEPRRVGQVVKFIVERGGVRYDIHCCLGDRGAWEDSD